MSVYRDQLGERSNNLINKLLEKGLGLEFYKGKCLEILDVTGWGAKDVYDFVKHLTPADVETADKFQESERLIAKYSDQLDEMEANQDPNSGKLLEVQTIALATYLMLEEPDREHRVPAGLGALINSDYSKSELNNDIETFLQKY
ncbi:hypothetical protein [Corynebacterium durum]|jgi:hypothetical protein|uniref:hypothetical protein n=1 Tax=Corynebacterium durum TaxID=61592 RepID=UPI0026DDABE7|nr:hypothetical protein [Corynebacterium durum]MDO4652993.1 hypothetical protein [Corynebacterium durum]